MAKWIDLTGKKIGKLLIIDGNLPDRKKVLARCDCSRELLVNKNNLLQNRTKSCGKGTCHCEFKNLINQKFGYLTVIKFLGKHPKRNINIWECVCICGNTIISYSDRLKNKNTQSCGCKRIQLMVEKIKKPDKHAIIVQKYHQYKCGAFGRNLCFELTFEEFRSLTLPKCHYCGYLPDKTVKKVNGIDRIDSKLGYTISNCVTCCSKCNYAIMQNMLYPMMNLSI